MRNTIAFALLLLNTMVISQTEIQRVDIDVYNSKPNHTDLKFLDTVLGNVQILGIGESTHGTKEFNLLYLKMFKYLVESHGHNTLFLEDEFIPCKKLDSYVKCRQNCDSVSVEVLNNWPWRTQEMNNIIEWIRKYNRRNEVNKISIIGVDIQKPKIMCSELNSILKASNIDTVAIPKTEKVTNEKKVNKDNLLFSNEAIIGEYQEKKRQINDDKANIYAEILERLIWNQKVNSNPKRRHLRDLAMGRNILSYINQYPGTKGMLIAHNAHIFKYDEGKKRELKNFVLTGGVLDKTLGEKYFCLIQDFDAGCFNAYHRIREGDKNSIHNYELSEVCIEESIDKTIGASLRDQSKTMTYISGSDLFEIIGEKYIKYHNIGAVFNPEKNNKHQTRDFFYSEKGRMDACIFHQNSTATSLLR